MKRLQIIGVNEAPDGTKTLVVHADGIDQGRGVSELPVSEEMFQMWLTRGSIEEDKKRPIREAATAAGYQVSKLWVPTELG